LQLFKELQKRNVFRVSIGYIVSSWLLIQVADIVLETIAAPDWVMKTLMLVLLLGFPVVAFFSWAYEVTPDGIKREAEVDREDSLSHVTARKLDRAILAVLVIALAYFAFDKFVLSVNRDAAPLETTAQTAPGPAPEAPTDEAGRSIAVLPFVNMSADADNEYFSDGVSEEILNALAAVPELKVAARTSAFAFKGSNQSIADIATQLGVSHVLEGSVRKAGDQVRITAQLIKADDGFHLWSKTYDRELTNIFAIQDEIAGSIAEMLQVQLLGEQKNFTTTKDLSPEMYEKFLKARFLMRRRNDNAMKEAETLTREVLAKTPNFPQGQVQLAEILVQVRRTDERDTIGEVRALAASALALDPDLSSAYMIKATALDDEDLLGKIRYLKKAIELDPNEPRPHHWLGIVYTQVGYLEKARQELQTAVDIEPDHANANGYLGFVLMLQGDFEGARYHWVEQVRLGNNFGRPRLVYVDILNRDLDKARQAATETAGLDSKTRTRLSVLINAIEDPSVTPQYLEHIQQPGLDEWAVIQELFLMGLYGEAMRLYEDGPFMLMSWAEFWSDARALPEFQQALKARNINLVWDELGPPPICRKSGESYDCRAEE
jgi:TolB-like protein/Flp pilus assembly protein TadD